MCKPSTGRDYRTHNRGHYARNLVKKHAAHRGAGPGRPHSRRTAKGVTTTALLDRLLHHSRVFNLDGESYRIQKKKEV